MNIGNFHVDHKHNPNFQIRWKTHTKPATLALSKIKRGVYIMNFDVVIEVKKRSHRSWINLKNAAKKEIGLPYSFSTSKVENSSSSYLRRAMKDSNLSASEILAEIEKRKLA